MTIDAKQEDDGQASADRGKRATGKVEGRRFVASAAGIMAELLCLEKDVDFQEKPEGQGPVCSYRDPAIFDDCTVLDNLLRSEERYPINPRYFACVQKELSVNMRRIVGRWMLEVCEVEQCRPEVYPLAMNCLDRFLSVRPVRKCQLQLTGAVCMLLASKFRQTKPLSLERLSMFTDYSVTREELKDWELVVVSTLKWDVCGVIACDFLDHLIHRLELPKEAGCSPDHIRSHAQTFISLCYTEFEFILSPASMIAAASISMAICGLIKLNWTKRKDVLQRLHDITSIEVDCLQDCQQRIEKALVRNYPELTKNLAATLNGTTPTPSPASTPSGDYAVKVSAETVTLESETPETPTDVQDVLF
ncbi:G1/S-specific cyclin-D2 [Dermacentor silvarum]|uniref:G1/S-specific cyclin-D2 n=1 Tax=Dermacentor silvarum TaxID=543639 RepID=UPI00189894CF|nr:G1/S-specific cyclin-D2 [Dermacentor silvarum]XP_049512477.1 G1/S-specific cyclin-D2 [Dermacentor silvarum]